MSGKNTLTFNNNPVDIKLTFANRYKLISAGLNYADGLITSSTPIESFCKCWSILLNQDYDPANTEGFLSSFNMLELVNPYYIAVLYRDGVISSSPDEADKEESEVKASKPLNKIDSAQPDKQPKKKSLSI